VRVLVTGAGGMLGRDTVEALGERGHSVIGLPRQELDITDAAAVEDAIAAVRPDAVVNCAAWTDVDGAQANERAAMRVNDTAAGIVSSTAAAHGASVLYVSSDYVFDGAKGSAYVESDLPAAISAYGRSKQAGETSTQIANPRHFIVRSSWLFGHGGPNFVETMLGRGPEVRAVDDQVGCPTFTGHLAEALVRLGQTEDYGIHHMAAAGSCSRFEFTREIFARAGVDTRVEPCKTADFPRPAARPPYSVLGSERGHRLPTWQEGLQAYLGVRV
jgi:dTDP-4-dehydrorhamnose reductase